MMTVIALRCIQPPPGEKPGFIIWYPDHPGRLLGCKTILKRFSFWGKQPPDECPTAVIF